MKQLVLVGAGNAGNEIWSWLSAQKNDFHLKGFIDDIKMGPNIIGKIQNYQPAVDDVFACTVANPSNKVELVELLEQRGAKFINIVHGSAVILSDIRRARGLIIAPFAYIANDVKVGNFVSINVFSSIGHNAIIGNWVTLSSHCDVTGHVVLEDKVFMGTSSSIIPGKVIGNSALIGAGSVVMRNVSAGITVFGMPAKKLM